MKTETSKQHKIIYPRRYDVSRDGKLDCRRLQFAWNIRMARTAARKYAQDLRAARKARREKSFYFDVCKTEFFPSTFSFSCSRTISLTTHCRSTSRRLCHSECRKTMSTYESAKEVYELLSVHESALFTTNGNVLRHTQMCDAIFYRAIVPLIYRRIFKSL